MSFIGHYTRKSPHNRVILGLLTRDRSVKFSRMVAPGVIEIDEFDMETITCFVDVEKGVDVKL